MHRKKMVVALAFILSVVMLLSSGMAVNAQHNAYAPARSNAIVNPTDNDVESRVFTMNEFDRVIVGGNWRVTYVYGTNHQIRVEMPSRMFDNYNFNVRGRTLIVERRGLLRSTNNSVRPHIFIYAPSLEAVNLSGLVTAENWSPVIGDNFTINISGSARANLNLQIAEYLTVNASGVSRLTMAGTTRDLRINGAGVVDIRAFDLQARDARPVSVAGVGTVELSVTDRLNVNAAGTTRVYFRGDPEVTRRVSGRARVTNVN